MPNMYLLLITIVVVILLLNCRLTCSDKELPSREVQSDYRYRNLGPKGVAVIIALSLLLLAAQVFFWVYEDRR
jgi:hypothetical protein